jgi:enamine deaminase RidA (YjgF/YER057c/UK114 family)
MRHPAALAIALIALTAGAASAQDAIKVDPKAPPKVELIPAPGGAVVIPSPRHRQVYDQYGYAPARLVGDTLYVSGAIIFRLPAEGTDAAAFEAQTRRTFKALDFTLKQAGASWDDVVMVNSFHVWDGPDFKGERLAQIEVMNKVRAEFTKAPHPAWTAVGTTGLLQPGGIVEVQLIAKVPEKS